MRHAWLLLLCLWLLPGGAAQADAFAQLLARESAPPGVVFDVDEWDHTALKWVVPQLEGQIRRLRERFPGLDIAVVSHGEEIFALMQGAERYYPQLHGRVQSLVGDGVAFHVCAGHAVMSGHGGRFVDFVQPVSAGVVTVAEYHRRGYVHVPVKPQR